LNPRLAPAVSFLVLVSLPALALEKPVARSKVPQAVLQSVASSYPKAKVLEIVIETEEKDPRKLYEVRIQDGDARVDLKIEAGGKLVAQEHILDVKAAPSPVTNAALAPPYQDWAIKRVEKVDDLEHPDQSGYEVTIGKSKRLREVLLTPQGALLKMEDEDDKK
jgi:hypothetical protein